MPYIVHRAETEAAIALSTLTGDLWGCYATKPEAVAERPHGWAVTFIATEDERYTWQTRERSRMRDGTYTRVPWPGTLYRLYDAPETLAYCLDLSHHYAHVSLEAPGMIAYTPDDAHGVADRQVRVKPGRYLTQYASAYMTAEQINEWTARVRAHTQELQLARTPDEIAAVYVAKNGPTSCMDGRHFDFASAPTRVYGDSDLAVAYLGEINTKNPTQSIIAARAVCWPAKKRYSRIYGDSGTLATCLENAGYARGSMNGARIRAVESGYRDSYVMPYIDGIDGADLDGDSFILGDGEYETQNTHGRTSEKERHYCQNDDCDEEVDSDTSYCANCEENRRVCNHCSDTFWDYSDGSEHHGYWYCNSCVDEHTQSCAACESEDVCSFDYSWSEQRNRNMLLCGGCEDMTLCVECDKYVEETNDASLCPKCAPKNRIAPRPRGIVLLHHAVGVSAVPAFVVPYTDGSIHIVDVLHTEGEHLVVHRDGQSQYYVVTHKPTRLRVTRNGYYSVDNAIAFTRQIKDADWSFTSVDTIPEATRVVCQNAGTCGF